MINETNEAAIVPGMVKGAVNIAIECFMLGLKEDVAQLMVGKYPTTLENAVSTAIDCERYTRQRQELRRERETRNRPIEIATCHAIEEIIGITKL